MARFISFVMLVAIIGVVGVLFFQVMARFLLPMFLALVIVVMFRPLHRWCVERCHGRVRIAAGFTTAIIILIFLVPVLLFLTRAAVDGMAVARAVSEGQLTHRMVKLRRSLDLELPPDDVRDTLSTIETLVIRLEDIETAGPAGATGPDTAPDGRTSGGNVEAAMPAAAESDRLDVAEPLIARGPPSGEAQHEDEAPTSSDKSEMATDEAPDVGESPTAVVTIDAEAALNDLKRAVRRLDHQLSKLPVPDTAEPARAVPAPLPNWAAELDAVKLATSALSDLPISDAAFVDQVGEVKRAYQRLRRVLVGGPMMYWLRLQANPSDEQVQAIAGHVQEVLAPLAVSTTQFLANFVIGLLVLVVSLYYFLADGPAMISTVMRLSPLDERYEKQILVDFDKLSRAVVVATVLSAVVQGLLAGVGYYLAGIEAVFLLTMLTMFFAMVPFVGAAAVWGSCALWLAFYENRMMAAAALAIYGALVVSMADNVIKPIVLHGQSNLHPLLALLSILGGVQALGPIGIFVGPMVVAFLQSLLNILHHELVAISEGGGDPEKQTAGT